ncbi:FtsH protease activity modulator HflK [Pelagicoccus sp. SDUM812002]|uniref:FtsH protease activity modulator HflK n=1 Tax=Pelagicoccus sp. SDUM812002 TaxID=3041266 RepID=UPI00280C8A17|nr:FtsH protease activity modulator HflK [Pelagicoccus sp. SDUM812002]MDQ8186034.1 FtsH protease activity modulator HflK [Pelagicoccus sp. SDUM812002]
MADRIEINVPESFKNLKGQFGGIFGLVAIGLLVWAGFSSVYTVPAESQGVVLRFGKYKDTVDPGLQFKLPFNIDQVEVVPVQRQMKQEFGFGSSGATNRTQYSASRSEQMAERSMVTGDLNAASVEWNLQYRIEDPKLFLFKVRDPEETLRDISESVMRTVVGDRTVDEVITIGRQEISVVALDQMQTLVDKYELGLRIDLVELQNVNPPEQVRPSFNEVNQAQQERESMINVANGEYNKVIPRARGLANQSIQEAEGYALKRVNEAEGDVARFEAMLKEYVKAPEVTKRRIYLETMQEVVSGIDKKIVLDSDASSVLPLLQLNQN